MAQATWKFTFPTRPQNESRLAPVWPRIMGGFCRRVAASLFCRLAVLLFQPANNMTQQPPALITRKEIALLTGLTVEIIRRNEGSLGLTPARVQWGTQRVRYKLPLVLAVLKAKGMV